jgi:hypothetical protein
MEYIMKERDFALNPIPIHACAASFLKENADTSKTLLQSSLASAPLLHQ